MEKERDSSTIHTNNGLAYGCLRYVYGGNFKGRYLVGSDDDGSLGLGFRSKTIKILGGDLYVVDIFNFSGIPL